MTHISYSREALISFNLHSTHRKPSLTPDSRWPTEILRENKGCDARKRLRGKRAGVRNRLRARAHRARLPSILLANVQFLDNKLDDLRVRIKFQRDIRDCNLLCFSEPWLNPAVPNHAIQPAGFAVWTGLQIRGKSRGGGVCVMVNNSWCNNANVVTLTRSCSPNLERLALKFCPFYLPREFTLVIVNTVYIPPQANMATALWELHEALTQFQAQHQDAALIVVGDFNSTNPKRAVSNLYQHVTFPTRGNRTLDHCYNSYKDSYKALAHPPFGKLDHTAIFLIPKYKQRLKRKALVQREVARWTDQSVATLQDALDDADCDMFQPSTDDVKPPSRSFPNQKPWVNKTTRDALNFCTAAYNVGIISGNMDEYKSAAYGVHRAVREAKRRYGRKLETQFQQSGSRSLWQGLRTITDYRSPPSGLMSAGESLANELNTFFAHVEATSSSANANSTNANNANGVIGAANGACAEPTIEQRPLIITESDVRRVFKRVNTRKAAGPDGICGRVLKPCADQLAPVFTDIFNLSLTLGTVSNFLTDRPQSVGVGDCVSSTLTLSTGAPQRCVLSPLLYSLYTYDCTDTCSSTIIVKFAEDTVVMCLISDNDERAYLEEIKHLENWCQENNLLLNISKTKELIVDCSKKQERHYQPVSISGTTVERLDSFRYLGVHISQDLVHLRCLRDFRLPSKVLQNFYTCTIKCILTGNITVWFGNSTKQDRQALQMVARSAEHITHMELPDLQTIYYKQCQTNPRG
ncbi:hypothetical protein P4O66_017870, partial [Electrophorus voltai]